MGRTSKDLNPRSFLVQLGLSARYLRGMHFHAVEFDERVHVAHTDRQEINFQPDGRYN